MYRIACLSPEGRISRLHLTLLFLRERTALIILPQTLILINERKNILQKEVGFTPKVLGNCHSCPYNEKKLNKLKINNFSWTYQRIEIVKQTALQKLRKMGKISQDLPLGADVAEVKPCRNTLLPGSCVWGFLPVPQVESQPRWGRVLDSE